METKRNDSGWYTITVDGHRFNAETMARVTEGEETYGWRLLREIPITWAGLAADGEPYYELEWCNDFCTLWECKEAAQETANDLNEK